jgi:peptidyl-prolyl cis-trans isomerase SurA
LQYINFLSGLFVFLFLSSFAAAQQPKEGDRILAIVGTDVILESDFQYQIQLYAKQNQLTQISPALAQQLFQQLLTEKIILAKADQDSITVTEDEVNRELDNRIKSLIEQFGSEQRVEEVYNMSIGKIKITLKEDLRKKLKGDKLKRQKFGSGSKATDKEIKEFYYSYKDSLPSLGKEYDLYHIFITRKVTEAEKIFAKEKALKILDSIKNGTDFSELAKRNSDDSLSALAGGDLGWAKRGSFVKEFEEELYRLKIGEVSNIVETEFGYHIIKSIDKKGDLIKSSHILVAYPKFESSDIESISYLNKIKADIESGTISFEDAAIKYSQDVQTNQKGGHIGLVTVDKLDSNVIEELKVLPKGTIGNPMRIGDRKNYGYELLKYTDIVEAHKLNLEQDYDRIKRYAEYYKENTELEKWINEIKQYIYVDVKL